MAQTLRGLEKHGLIEDRGSSRAKAWLLTDTCRDALRRHEDRVRSPAAHCLDTAARIRTVARTGAGLSSVAVHLAVRVEATQDH